GVLNSAKRIPAESRRFPKDKASKEPHPELAKVVKKRCYENGLIVEIGGYFDNVLRFLPPLITTKKIAENGLKIFKKATLENFSPTS
ncbi:MAG: hypothetical protein AAB821_01390, partial [Patescibacteria group bacterium]